MKTNATEGCLAHTTAHKTNESVLQQVTILTGRQELLPSTVKHSKLSRFGQVCRHDTLTKITLKGTLDGSCHRPRPRKSWNDNTKIWIGQSIASHSRQKKLMSSHHSRGICQSAPNDDSVSWELVMLISLKSCERKHGMTPVKNYDKKLTERHIFAKLGK